MSLCSASVQFWMLHYPLAIMYVTVGQKMNGSQPTKNRSHTAQSTLARHAQVLDQKRGTFQNKPENVLDLGRKQPILVVSPRNLDFGRSA